jgi:hypothetical protein
MSKWKRLQQRKLDMRGVYSESHHCIDCNVDTAPGWPNRAEAERSLADCGGVPLKVNAQTEIYMVHDHVWKAAGMELWGGCLCVGCLEMRLGRKLTPDDFPPHVFNTDLPGTPRLLERQGSYDPLGAFEE